MPSLLDIAPPAITAEEVDIRGTRLSVAGVSAKEWARLYARFPDLRAVVAGQAEGTSNLAAFAGQVALIAAGLGKPADEKIEHVVMERLSRDEMRQLTETIVRLSLPGHVYGPLLNGAALAPAAAPPDTEASVTR
jgi:hypothetical protein